MPRFTEEAKAKARATRLAKHQLATLETLEERYKDDPQLLAFYKRNLPIRGWAGRLDDCEKQYLNRVKPAWRERAKETGRVMALNRFSHNKPQGQNEVKT